MPVIATVLSAQDDRDAVMRAAEGRALVHHCIDVPSLAARLQSTTVDLIVCTPHDRNGDETLELLSFGSLGACAGVVVLRAVTSRIAERLLTTIRRNVPIEFVLNSPAALADSILARLETAFARDAQRLLLSRIALFVTRTTAPILVAGLALSARDGNVGDLEAACRLSGRAIERRLHANGLVAPRELLASMRAIHVLWQLAVLDRPMKRIAVEFGFASTSSLSRFLKSEFGSEPAALRLANIRTEVDACLCRLKPSGPASPRLISHAPYARTGGRGPFSD